MENKDKVAKSIAALENAEKIVLEDFYQNLYIFLLEIKVIDNEKDFLHFVFANQMEIKRFLNKYNII